MIEFTIKTLESNNHQFSVEDETTVAQLKEQIRDQMGIEIDMQRLIFCGRVLTDERRLSECDVHGKVIHLVPRPPPSPISRAPSNPRQEMREALDEAHRVIDRMANQPANRRETTPSTRQLWVNHSLDPPSDLVIDQHQSWMMSPTANRLELTRRILDDVRTSLTALRRHVANDPSGSASTEQSSTAVQSATATTEQSATTEEPAKTGQSTTSAVPMETDSQAPIAEQEIATEGPHVGSVTTEESKTESTSGEQPQTESTPGEVFESQEYSSDPQSQQTDGMGDISNDTSRGATRRPRPRARATRSNRPTSSRPRYLAQLIEELGRLHQEFAPYQADYLNILRDTNNSQLTQEERLHRQGIAALVCDVMHSFSHAYHAMSDISITINERYPLLTSGFSANRQPIPVQAHINVVHTTRRPENATTTTSGSTNTTNTTNGAANPRAEGQTPAAGRSQPQRLPFLSEQPIHYHNTGRNSQAGANPEPVTYQVEIETRVPIALPLDTALFNGLAAVATNIQQGPANQPGQGQEQSQEQNSQARTQPQPQTGQDQTNRPRVLMDIENLLRSLSQAHPGVEVVMSMEQIQPIGSTPPGVSPSAPMDVDGSGGINSGFTLTSGQGPPGQNISASNLFSLGPGINIGNSGIRVHSHPNATPIMTSTFVPNDGSTTAAATAAAVAASVGAGIRAGLAARANATGNTTSTTTGATTGTTTTSPTNAGTATSAGTTGQSGNAFSIDFGPLSAEGPFPAFGTSFGMAADGASSFNSGIGVAYGPTGFNIQPDGGVFLPMTSENSGIASEILHNVFTSMFGNNPPSTNASSTTNSNVPTTATPTTTNTTAPSNVQRSDESGSGTRPTNAPESQTSSLAGLSAIARERSLQVEHRRRHFASRLGRGNTRQTAGNARAHQLAMACMVYDRFLSCDSLHARQHLSARRDDYQMLYNEQIRQRASRLTSADIDQLSERNPNFTTRHMAIMMRLLSGPYSVEGRINAFMVAVARSVHLEPNNRTYDPHRMPREFMIIRMQMREYVHRLLDTIIRNNSERPFDAVACLIINSVRSFIDRMTTVTPMDTEVQPSQSLRRWLRLRMPAIIACLMSDTSNDMFVSRFYEVFASFFTDLCAMVMNLCINGFEGLRTVYTAFINSLTVDFETNAREWLRVVARENLMGIRHTLQDSAGFEGREVPMRVRPSIPFLTPPLSGSRTATPDAVEELPSVMSMPTMSSSSDSSESPPPQEGDETERSNSNEESISPPLGEDDIGSGADTVSTVSHNSRARSPVQMRSAATSPRHDTPVANPLEQSGPNDQDGQSAETDLKGPNAETNKNDPSGESSQIGENAQSGQNGQSVENGQSDQNGQSAQALSPSHDRSQTSSSRSSPDSMRFVPPVMILEHWGEEWVPVFTRDQRTQRERERPQEPHSDAYLSGMPSRKRRCVRASRPPTTLDGFMNESVREASDRPAPLDSTQLRSVLRDSVRSLVRTRADTSEDYDPVQYSSAARFLEQAKPSKKEPE